jgi:hypothetical protein
MIQNNKFFKAERYQGLKILIFMSIILTQILMISAFDFDNSKIYDVETKTATITNAFGLGEKIADITLITPQINYVIDKGDGIMQLVAETEFNNFQKDYSGALDKIDLYNSKSIKLNRMFEYRYRIITEVKQIPIYERTCTDGKTLVNKSIEQICTNKITSYTSENIYSDWKAFKEVSELPEGKVRVGIFTDVKPRDNVEWIPTWFGVRVNEWAVWTDALNVRLNAYYNFDDGSGTRLNNTYNVTVNNGTLQNMPSSAWTTGLLGGGLIFNGSNQWVGNISKPTNVTNLANNYTISLWFKPTDNLYEGIMSQYTTGTSAGEFIIAKQATGKVIFYRKIGTTDAAANSVTSTSSIALNSWNHIIVQSYSNGTIKFYFNGTLEDEIESLDGAGTEWDAGMLIGMGSSLITKFNGTIDEVGIWGRILSNYEISDLYNLGVGITYSATTTPSISVTLDSPVDSLITSLNTLKFNSSAVMVAGNFTNATLRIYNTTTSIFGTNFTTINGTSNSTSLALSSLVPGSYIWNVEYCGNATTTIVCSSSSSNRTFTISSFTENSQTFNVNTTETSIETF